MFATYSLETGFTVSLTPSWRLRATWLGLAWISWRTA